MIDFISANKITYEDALFRNKANAYYLMSGVIVFFASPLLFFIIIGLTSPFFYKVARDFLGPLLLIVSITFYSTLKPFSDLAEYLNVYHQVNDGSIDIFSYSRFGYGLECLTLIIMKVVGFLSGNNDQAFLLSIYTIIFTYIYLICKSINNKYSVFFFCIIFLSLGMLESLSYFLRQNLSVVMFLYGLLCARSKKIRWLYFLLSFTSHISGAINVAIYLFSKAYKKKINNVNRMVKLILILIISLICLIALLQFTSFGQVLLDKAKYVINKGQYSTLPLPYILLTTVNLILLMLFLSRYKEDNIVMYYLLLKEAVLFYLTLPFPAVPNRLGMILFSYSAIFLYSNLKSTETKRKIISVFAISMINIMGFIYSMYNVTLHNNNFTFYENSPFTYNIYNVVNYIYDACSQGVVYIDSGNG